MTTTSTAPTTRGQALEVVDVRDLPVDEVRSVEPFALAAALGRLSHADLEDLAPEQAEAVVAASQRLINAVSAIQAEAVVTFADRVDEELDAREQARRADFRARRQAALDAGRPFSERWFPMPGRGSYAASALAPLLRISPRAMSTRLARARRVAHDMTGISELARSGDLEPYRVEAVARAAEILETRDLPEMEARILAKDLTDLPVSDLARRARRAASATDRSGAAEVAARARSRRRVCCSPDRDVPGMTSWRFSLPSEVSSRLWRSIDELAMEYAAARRDAGDPVTIDQARADALCDLVLQGVRIETTLELVVPVAALHRDGTLSAPDRRGCRCGDPAVAGVFVSADRRTPSEVLVGDGEHDPVILSWVGGQELWQASEMESLLALRLMDHLEVTGNPHLTHDPPGTPSPPAPTPCRRPDLIRPPDEPSARAPARTSWFVPGLTDAGRVGELLPEDVLALLADPATRLRIVGSDPTTGAVCTEATVAYRPAAPLARRVRRRDGTCRFPGCGTPAERCDLDHVVRWPDGPTTAENLVTLCRTHHGFKHHAGWMLAMSPLGVCTWRAPTGRRHTTHPLALHDLAT